MKGSDKIATLVIALAVVGVVVLKCIQLELSYTTIGLLVFGISIGAVIYFWRRRGKRRMN